MENQKDKSDFIFWAVRKVLNAQKIECNKRMIIESALKRGENTDIIVSNSYLTLKIIVDDKKGEIVNNQELIDLYLFLEKILRAKND